MAGASDCALALYHIKTCIYVVSFSQSDNRSESAPHSFLHIHIVSKSHTPASPLIRTCAINGQWGLMGINGINGDPH